MFVSDIFIGHAAWRFDSKIAKVLDPSKHAVVSNHYAIDEEKICRVMYRYAIHLYPYRYIADYTLLILLLCIDSLVCDDIGPIRLYEPRWGRERRGVE